MPKHTDQNASKKFRIVTDDDGKEYKLYVGDGSLKRNFDIDPRIDFTKPVWAQVQRLARKDKREEVKRNVA